MRNDSVTFSVSTTEQEHINRMFWFVVCTLKLKTNKQTTKKTASHPQSNPCQSLCSESYSSSTPMQRTPSSSMGVPWWRSTKAEKRHDCHVHWWFNSTTRIAQRGGGSIPGQGKDAFPLSYLIKRHIFLIYNSIK